MTFFAHRPARGLFAVAAFGLLLALAATVSSQPARAQAGFAQVCGKYADTAVSQDQQNRRRDCGYNGKHWSSNRGDHIRWCESVFADRKSLRKQTEERDQMLERCDRGGKSGKSGKNNDGGGGIIGGDAVGGGDIGRRCSTYADNAVKQSRAARKNRCGFDGARWSTDRAYHLRWCQDVGGNKKMLQEQTQERRLQLSKCR